MKFKINDFYIRLHHKCVIFVKNIGNTNLAIFIAIVDVEFTRGNLRTPRFIYIEADKNRIIYHYYMMKVTFVSH